MFQVVLELFELAYVLLLSSVWIAKKDSPSRMALIMRLYVTSLFFGLTWETMGTGYAWSYSGFSLYVMNDVPLALLFGWPTWITLFGYLYVLLLRWTGASALLPRGIMLFLIGVLGGLLVEVLGVGFGWWFYLSQLPLWWSLIVSSRPIHIITFLGWGLIVGIQFFLADGAYELLRRRRSGWQALGLLAAGSMALGVGLFLLLGLLYLYLPWSR